MKTPKTGEKRKVTKKWFAISLIIIIFISISYAQLSLVQNVSADSSQWVLNVVVMNKNNQTITNSTFAPFDLVQLKANVTYGGEPRANIPVAFKIVGPENSSKPTSLVRTAETDVAGAAVISFRIPMGNDSENPVLGTWKANCTASATNQTLQNTAVFKVDWPITIQNIKLLDQNNIEANNFTRGQTVKAQITVENANSQQINVFLKMNVTDVAGTKISEVTLQDQTLNGSSTLINSEFLIPENASVGQARIDVNLYTNSSVDQQNVQLADAKSATFTIQGETETQPTPNPEYRDVGLTSTNLSANQLKKGQTLEITITAQNKGNRSEQSTINIKYGDKSAGSLAIEFSAVEIKNVTYLWNTTEVSAGTYNMTVSIDAVAGENQTSDNELTAGTVTVTDQQLSMIPSLSATSLYIVTLFIVGLTTFSLLSFLRWRKIKPATIKIPMPLKQEGKYDELKTPRSPMPEVPSLAMNRNASAAQPSYASVLPTLTAASPETADKLTDELTQLKLQSIELLPLSGRAIDLSIQKIQVLRASKASKEQLQYELAELDKIVDLQTKAMETEISILKGSVEKVRALSKNTIQISNPQVEANEKQQQQTEVKEQKNTTD